MALLDEGPLHLLEGVEPGDPRPVVAVEGIGPGVPRQERCRNGGDRRSFAGAAGIRTTLARNAAIYGYAHANNAG